MSLFLRNLEVKARGGGRSTRPRYSPLKQRPYTLPQARSWATERLISARHAHAIMLLNPNGGRGRAANQRRANRLERVHQGAQATLAKWEKTRRAPKGFRRGVAAATARGRG